MQGPITKTGTSHARGLLVEASWHHRKQYRLGRELMRRQASQPPAVPDRADRGNRRVHQRWKRFDARDKRPTIAAVAVAREPAGVGASLSWTSRPEPTDRQAAGGRPALDRRRQEDPRHS
ncbi:hypothetical protein QFZ22_000970 [Streptomyces canus]|uniref:Transposase n=1 Tax=Streptomyces canus TaxID=58343 RepID=A0AAW8F778_9ACTN|nr:hypothetical protein [Streptomyces canus]MDQ0904985.1 hypothetical protein [Streptomyces canus]